MNLQIPLPIAGILVLAALWFFSGFSGCELTQETSELKTKTKQEWRLVPLFENK